MAEPIKPTNYISEVLTGQTAAQWEASGGSVYLQAFETVIESDTGKRKTGPGLFSELPYDNPQGQTWQNTTGTPDSNDLIGYTAVTPAVTATAEWTCDDVGTVGATIIVGNKLYTVVASGATGDQIDDGASATAFADNIATKVTTDTADTLCTAENVGAVITFTANTTGAAGNNIPLSTTDVNITADVFVDGADAVYTPKATSALALAGGNGDVTGPASAVNNNLAAFDGTTGKLVKDAGINTSQVATSQTAATAVARLALTGLARGARVYQTDNGFWYELTNAAAPSDAASWQAQPKVYRGLGNQASTNAPEFTVSENSIGAVVWTYSSTGYFIGTLASAFPENKTLVFVSIGSQNADANLIKAGWATANSVDIQTLQIDLNPTNGTDLISLSILVYP